MEIKAWIFFSFWAINSIIFLKLGFNALDRTNLSTSVSPVVLFLFKHALAISLCHSSDYNFVYCPQVKVVDNRYPVLIWVLLLLPFIYATAGLPVLFYFPIYGFASFYNVVAEQGLYAMMEDDIGLFVDYVIKLTMIAIGDNKKFFPILALLIGRYTSAVWNAISEDESFQEVMPLTAVQENGSISFSNSRKKKNGKLISFGVGIMGSILLQNENSGMLKKMMFKRRKLVEFAIGMVGTILFQNFFKLTSFDHVLAFLYFAVAWVGNLALLRPPGDFGVFNFLLGNVIVGCTVSQFGLRVTTWIAYGASLLLYGLRLKIESLSLENRGREEPRVIVW